VTPEQESDIAMRTTATPVAPPTGEKEMKKKNRLIASVRPLLLAA